MIELLAITDDPAPTAPPLRVVPAAGLGVIVEPAPEGELDADALWQRESRLEALMQERALLPVRLGTRVEDDAAAAEAIAPRSAELRAALDRLRVGVHPPRQGVGEPLVGRCERVEVERPREDLVPHAASVANEYGAHGPVQRSASSGRSRWIAWTAATNASTSARSTR